MNLTNKYKDKAKPYLYILPLFILLTMFYVLPIIISLILSFTKFNIINTPKFIGLKNYIKLFSDKTFIASLKNTFLFTLITVPTQSILALLLANFLVRRKKSKINEIAKCIIFIPVICSMVLMAIIFRIILNGDTSPLNLIFEFFNINHPNWLGNPKLVLYTLSFITVYKNIGYFMVIYISGLMDIPESYYEACKIDGCNKFKEFIHITVPMLNHINILVLFLGLIWSFQTFDLIYNLTGGGPGNASVTMVVNIYNVAFKQFRAGYAMAIGNVLFLIIAFFSILQKRLLKKDEY
ncbi:MAG: sugar ABC transporter permease [Peptostreptococcaceae bacterium]|jgi:multiple sugar transport system permease protein|nr:sugar ABC transporter permease [Peptostreptococcaceae bacterium]